jgi:hypothetical protein
MFGMNRWDILGIIAIISLIVFCRKKPNAVWGGLIVGVIGVLLITLIQGFTFVWFYVSKILIAGILLGTFIELIVRITGKQKLS